MIRIIKKLQHGIEVGSVTFQQVKNSDMREATVERDGEVLLRIAIANGFRNIQNLVQRMKRKKCTYDYVEVMACPSGSHHSSFIRISLSLRGFFGILKGFIGIFRNF